MSYIRCLSNPEGAYVYRDCSGHVMFSTSRPNNVHWRIPVRHFNEICRKWDNYDRPAKYGEFSVSEAIVWQETQQELTEAQLESLKDVHYMFDSPPREYKVKVTWKGESEFFWPTTWEIIVGRVVRRLAMKKRRKKKR